MATNYIEFTEEAIQARADAEGDDGTKIALGTPGSVIQIPGVGGKATGVAWKTGRTFDMLVKGLLDAMWPIGSVRPWNLTVGAIPAGWQICDGTSGTPNLVGRFLKGAVTSGATGGSANTGTTGSTTQVQSGSGVFVASVSHTHPFEPPFYEMIFICRTS